MHACYNYKSTLHEKFDIFYFLFFYGLFPLYLYYDSICCEGSDDQVPSVFCLQNLS